MDSQTNQPTLLMETWKPIPGWEDSYAASDLGRIKSLARVVMRRSGRPLSIKERILRPAPNVHGHLTVALSIDGKPKTRPVHSLVAAAFLGPRPDGKEVCHGDGDQLNNQITNLRYGTRKENVADAMKHGTHICLNQ